MKSLFLLMFLLVYSHCLAYQEIIEHGELYLRDVTDYKGSGFVELIASADEEYIEVKYEVNRGRRSFCPSVDMYMVQNKIQTTLLDCEVEYVPPSWNGCGDIMEGETTYVKISSFPGWFDFCSDFRIFFGIWEFNDYVDVVGCELPSTTTTIIISSTTTTTITEDDCPTEELYGEYSEEAKLLRYFRDNILCKTPEGQEFIRLYYEWGTAIVKVIEEDIEFKKGVKSIIDEILLLIRAETK